MEVCARDEFGALKYEDGGEARGGGEEEYIVCEEGVYVIYSMSYAFKDEHHWYFYG